MKDLITLVAFAMVCYSCQQQKSDTSCIDVRINFPEKEVLLTDIADVTYLHLSSDNDDYLYSDYGTINDISENTIVILDWRSGNILFFNKDGTPKSRFNRLGNGPGEYQRAYRVFYDEVADDVFVIDSPSLGVIQVYSSAGVHKRELILPQGVIVDENSMVSFDNHSFLFYDVSFAVKRASAYFEKVSIKEEFIAPFYLISKAD